MCTALSLKTKDHYFGRNLDLDRSYGEEVVIMPRNFSMEFRMHNTVKNHYAMIGMATIVGKSPLFYDATNEHGLSMAGLNFPQNAYFAPPKEGKDNITPFEFIPWIVGRCKDVREAKGELARISLVNIPFSEMLPLSPLHWMIADRDESIVVEQMQDGLHIYDNPTHVMTNNPPFNYHLMNLNNYRRLSVENGDGSFSPELELDNFCQGLGAVGLPGDVSSMSRFIRAAFGRANSVCNTDEASSVSQFFHLLSSVEMSRGICKTSEGGWDITVYSSCVNTDRGLYYYTTYDNRAISCIDMHKADLNGCEISRFSLITKQNIYYQN